MTAHPRYLLKRPLGEGGMAVIHLATQVTPAGDRLVAIKQIERREQVGSAAHARLVTEARLVFQLTHANICQVLDLGENEQGTFIVIEYVHGCDLGELAAAAEASGGLDVPICLYVAREVARALDYAHRRTDAAGSPMGLVHGDVAPRNVLLSVEGEVKLADFGIARARGILAPGSGLVGGTPGFIAPEVVDGSIDLRSDIYSLGKTIARTLGGALDDLAARPELGGVREIVHRATAREPAARFPSAGEMERALALELSRRYPGFTPSVLAHLVARHAVERDARHSPAGGARAAGSTATTFAMHTLIEPGPAPGATPFAATLLAAGLGGRTETMVPARRRPLARRRRRRIIALATAGVLAAVGASIAVALRSETPAEPAVVAAPPPAADAAPVAASPAPPPEPASEPTGAPVPSEPTGAPVPPAPIPSPPRAPTAHKAVRPPAREPGFVSVSATPWGAVYIDGKRVADETPLYRHPLAPGRHQVRVYYSELKLYSERRTVDLRAGQHRSIGFER